MKKLVDGEAYWISTDEAQDVIGSLRQVLRMASFIESDVQSWKWFFIALHSALQGACICHLTSTASPVGATTPKNTEEWLEYFEKSRNKNTLPRPKTHLMSLPDLLKKIRKVRTAGDGRNEQGIQISDHELEWLRSFHENVRNQFTHFEPCGWSIEVSGIPALRSLISRIILEIEAHGWAFRHLSADQKLELRSLAYALAKSPIVGNVG